MVAKILYGAGFVISRAFYWTGLVLCLPFLAVGMAFDGLADNLKGDWRRGREQNWLWRWARSRSNEGR